MEKSECDIWLEAAKQVLKDAGVPMHYMDIKRVILQKQLVSPGLKSTLESALQEDSERKISERQIFSVEGQPGYFMFMKEEIKVAEETLTPKSHQKSQTKGKTVNETKSKGKGQAETKPKVKVKLKIENEEKVQGKEPKIEVTDTGKVKASIKMTNDQETDKISINGRYEKKYRKLRRYAKDLIFLNAAYCDEVIYTEEQISKATAERKYLLNRLLHRRNMAMTQSANHTSSGGTSKMSSLYKSQSIAQILNSMEKRTKKKAAVNKSGAKTAKQMILEEGKTSKVKKSVKLSNDFKPKVLDSVTVDMTPKNEAFPMDVG